MYSCKNRVTKAIITRRETQEIATGESGYTYPRLVRILHCDTHHVDGPRFIGHTHAKATAAQRHPWEWCPECARLKGVSNG